jgi:LPXTG-motif cell wall-anchored protein
MKGPLFKSTILMLIMSLFLLSLSFTASAAATAPNLGSASTFGLMGVSISNPNPQVIQQQNLVLSALCSDTPIVNRKWNVHNPNATAVSFIYAIQGTVQVGSQTIAANSDAQITTITESTNEMNLLVNGAVQTFITNTGAACTAVTASPTPIATPTTKPATTPTATATPGPTPVAAVTPTPSPVATPGPCLNDVTTASIKTIGVPAGAKLVSKKTSAIMIWRLSNGSLMIKATLPEKTKGRGIWSFDLGGQIYTVNGSEGVTYTIVNPPVGTYSAVTSFASDCGQPVIKLLATTITVPTVTGGILPNTSTPWYNIMFLGTVMFLIGSMIWRKRKLRD